MNEIQVYRPSSIDDVLSIVPSDTYLTGEYVVKTWFNHVSGWLPNLPSRLGNNLKFILDYFHITGFIDTEKVGDVRIVVCSIMDLTYNCDRLLIIFNSTNLAFVYTDEKSFDFLKSIPTGLSDYCLTAFKW